MTFCRYFGQQDLQIVSTSRLTCSWGECTLVALACYTEAGGDYYEWHWAFTEGTVGIIPLDLDGFAIPSRKITIHLQSQAELHRLAYFEDWPVILPVVGC